MNWKKMSYVLFAACLFLSLGLITPDQVFCQEPIELKVSHFGPSTWSLQKDFLEPWAKKIEAQSGNRVKFTFYPNQSLGKASEQFDLVINGTADIVLSITEYTPGKFPLSSVMTLPLISKSGLQSSTVYWNLYEKYLKDEFKDVKVLALFCHGPGHLHTVSKPVQNLDDLKGLRIRASNAALGRVIDKLGAIPVIATVNEAQTFLKEGKLDGVLLPWEGVMNFKFLDTCKFHTEINMYTLPFYVVMNKQKYDSLPADIRKAIDDNSGRQLVSLAGMLMDSDDAKGKGIAQNRGDPIYALSGIELERWEKMIMSIGDSWVSQMDSKKLPGQEVLAYVMDMFSDGK